MLRRTPLLAVALMALAACTPSPSPTASSSQTTSPPPSQTTSPSPGPAPSAVPTPAQPPPPAPHTVRVVFFGDSLTAGLGLAADEAFPAVLGRSLTDAGLPVTVVNAGVSGDTTAGGLARLDWTLSQKPDVFVLELGGNDMLRGLPVADAKANLHAIAEKALASGAAVVLAGMRANPSLGPDYVAQFDRIYPDLAKELGVPILPFVLEGVAGDPALTQADGLHPTAEGHRRIAERLLPVLQPVVTAKARTP